MKSKLEKCMVVVLLASTSAVLIFLSNLKIENKSVLDGTDYLYNPFFRDMARVFNNTGQYLINTPNCKIPSINPFIAEVQKFYHHQDYFPCSKLSPLSYITKEENHYNVFLQINKSLISKYSYFDIHCCYSVVTRVSQPKAKENKIKFSECRQFEDRVEIVDPLIKVICKNPLSLEVYSNIHAIVSPIHLPSPEMETFDMIPNAKSTFNVLLIGIDSVSKLNLIRTMPKTYSFLQNKDFINLKGYTKIGENTFPNLMGILAGMTTDQLGTTCDFVNKIDHCPNIWKQFQERGYITAYAEDSSHISSFNYEKMGFTHPPTDFYFRPYFLAAESLHIIERANMYYCVGPETEGERIMNLAKDFQITFKDYPKFGLFWMNSFSHDDLNMPSSMDEKVKKFLEDIYQHLHKTIMIFMSDHGFRFGELRNTQTGWLEERTPVFYIHVPEDFKKKYPKSSKNLLINSGRLTSGYDIYMTLQNIIRLADKKYSTKPSLACPKCHSLFLEISPNRSCYDAGIEQKWCVCNTKHPLMNITRKNPEEFLVDEINQLVKSYKQGYKCQNYRLDKVTFSEISTYQNEFHDTKTSVLIRVSTKPHAIFEGLIQLPDESSVVLRLLGDISRLNRYAPYSNCIENSPVLEKYCYCHEQNTTIFERISRFIFPKDEENRYS